MKTKFRLVLAVMLMMAATCCGALANPTGGNVVSGRATITPGSGGTVIRQWSDNAIINWKTFNIGPSEIVQFLQSGANAVALNRILGGDPSVILGKLTANGKIFLVNPDGIFFGKGAVVDVNSLMATTMNIADGDFMNGKYHFTADSTAPPSYVINLGQIKSAFGGYVALVAPLVNNDGAITSQYGNVTLAGTRASTVDLDGTGLVHYVAPVNLPPGTVVLPAGFVTNVVSSAVTSQTPDAGSLVVNPNGTVSLVGGAGVSAHGGIVSANGGNVYVLGDNKVRLDGNAVIDVSSPFVAGTAIVGGSPSDATVPQSASTYVGNGVNINANTVGYGNGGHIVVDSAGQTTVNGTLTATGGACYGNGGLIETSGHTIAVNCAKVNASAPKGLAGHWLLDPFNVCIVGPGGGGSNLSGCGVFTPSSNSILSACSITSVLSGGTSVCINTGSSGTSCGNITLVRGNNCNRQSAVINPTVSGNVSLTLNAANNIVMQSGTVINNRGNGTLNVNLKAGGCVNINQGCFFGAAIGGGGPPCNGPLALSINAGRNINLNGGCSSFFSSLINVTGNIGLQATNAIKVASAAVYSSCGNITASGGALCLNHGQLGAKNVTACMSGAITMTGCGSNRGSISAVNNVALKGSSITGNGVPYCIRQQTFDVRAKQLCATATGGNISLVSDVASLNANATGNVAIQNVGSRCVYPSFATNSGDLSIGAVTAGGNVCISTAGVPNVGPGVVPRGVVTPNACGPSLAPASITLGTIKACGGIHLTANGNIINGNSNTSSTNLTAGSCSSLSAGTCGLPVGCHIGFIDPLVVNINGKLTISAFGQNACGVSADIAGLVKPSNSLCVAANPTNGKIIFTDLTPPPVVVTPTPTPTNTPTPTPTTTSTPQTTPTPTATPTTTTTTTTCSTCTTSTTVQNTITQSTGAGQAQINQIANQTGITLMDAGTTVTTTTTSHGGPSSGPAISPIGYTSAMNDLEPPQNGNPDRFILSQLLQASLSDATIPVAGLESDLDTPLTRAEFVAFIINAMGEGEAARKLKGTPSYEDTTNHWASGYIAEGLQLGLLNGQEKRFYPDRRIELAEALYILLKALGLPPTTGGYPENVMTRATELDILTADVGSASSTPSRGRMYQMLDRAFYNVKMANGKTFYQTRFVKRPPVVTLTPYPALSQATSITLTGKVSLDTTRLLVGYSDKDVVPIHPDGTFTATVPLNPGLNSITIQAHDPLGNITSQTIQIMCTAGI